MRFIDSQPLLVAELHPTRAARGRPQRRRHRGYPGRWPLAPELRGELLREPGRHHHGLYRRRSRLRPLASEPGMTSSAAAASAAPPPGQVPRNGDPRAHAWPFASEPRARGPSTWRTRKSATTRPSTPSQTYCSALAIASTAQVTGDDLQDRTYQVSKEERHGWHAWLRERAALVSTEWVAEHLDDPQVRLIEVDVDTTAYDQGHIPGAVGFNWTTQLSDRIRRDIPTKAAWEQLLASAGVGHDTPDRLLRRQQQLVRRLRLLAAQDVRPQGRRADERRPQEVGARGPPADHRRAAVTGDQLQGQGRRTWRSAPTATRSCSARRRRGGKALVDVRSPAEFTRRDHRAARPARDGASAAATSPARRTSPGRRPSTTTAPSSRADELRALYGGKGITPDKDDRSPTAASASARRTPGSCSSSCSATRTSATTTAPGPSGAA